jgi:hypothetical protein
MTLQDKYELLSKSAPQSRDLVWVTNPLMGGEGSPVLIQITKAQWESPRKEFQKQGYVLFNQKPSPPPKEAVAAKQ